MLKVKRVYDPPSPGDGRRILVDRLWPRGLTKERVQAEWRRDLAPSDGLRKWFGHDPAKAAEFRRRYRKELEEAGKIADLEAIAEAAKAGDVTLLFGAKDPTLNQAVVLGEFIRSL